MNPLFDGIVIKQCVATDEEMQEVIRNGDEYQYSEEGLTILCYRYNGKTYIKDIKEDI